MKRILICFCLCLAVAACAPTALPSTPIVQVSPTETPTPIPTAIPNTPTQVVEVTSLPTIPPGLPPEIQSQWSSAWTVQTDSNGFQTIYNPEGEAILTSPDGLTWERVGGENSLTYVKVDGGQLVDVTDEYGTFTKLEGGQLVEVTVELETFEYTNSEGETMQLLVLPDAYAVVGWGIQEGEWVAKDQRTYYEGEWMFGGSLASDLEKFDVDFLKDTNARSGYNIKSYPMWSQIYFGIYMKYDWQGGTLLAVRHVNADETVEYKFAYTPTTGPELTDVATSDTSPVFNQFLLSLAAQH
jgi:hypothetical protein